MFLTPKDFAAAIGIKYGTLRQHILKKKVIKSGKLIDTEFGPNIEYIKQQTDGTGLDYSKISKTSREVPGKAEVKKAEFPNGKIPEISMPNQKDANHVSYSLRKQRAEMLLKEMEIQKKMGNLMPVEMVEKIMAINIHEIFRSFESECENVASIYCEVLGGDRVQLSDMVNLMRASIQRTIQEVKEKARKEIELSIADYAEVRSRGEKK